LPYLAELEKTGIPTVVIDFEDQTEMVKQTALTSGVPSIRYIHASRTLPGPADVDVLMEPVLEALTRPLTEEEKKSGSWSPPLDRIIFEGTLDEADKFFQQTLDVPFPLNAPVAVYTDGLPVRLPTEERVKEMLTGTSRKPDEIITYQVDIEGFRGGTKKKGTPVKFQPMGWTATVEKVATIAVMAGCRPEQLPVVLAMTQSECPTGTTGSWSQWVCVSGPIAKEIKMNTGVGMLEPGNPANSAIGRAYQLMAINLGGAIPGVNRMNSIGSPFNTGGTCFAENADALPQGWKGLNEEYGFGKDESIIMVMNQPGVFSAGQFSPGGYRAFQKSGHGALARRFDVKGTPGPHMWLEYIVPDIWNTREGGFTFIMVPEMAQHLWDLGYKSKEAVYDWLYEKSKIPLKDYRNRSWPDMLTNGWLGIERTSGKHWKELSDDYMVPLVNDKYDNCILIGGGEEEVCTQLAGRRGLSSAFSIDGWR